MLKQARITDIHLQLLQ